MGCEIPPGGDGGVARHGGARSQGDPGSFRGGGNTAVVCEACVMLSQPFMEPYFGVVEDGTWYTLSLSFLRCSRTP